MIHKHIHSLYLLCFNCSMWGIPTPDSHHDGAKCSNCGSNDTIAYYPKCCVKNDDT